MDTRKLVKTAAAMAGSNAPCWISLSDALGHVVSLDTKDEVFAIAMLCNDDLKDIIWC